MGTLHFHRLFRRIVGLTPPAYIKAQCAQRMRDVLLKEGNVTQAKLAAGYGITSRFLPEADHAPGMAVSSYKRDGNLMQIRFAWDKSVFGSILVACSTRGICAILIGDDPDALLRDLRDRFPQAELIGGDPEFGQLLEQVIAFVEQPDVGLALPLDLRGTVFQQRVWQALSQIPLGQTMTYTEIATRIGAPRAVRAVASACAANPLAVAIPCHRVVRTDGNLAGYRWGLERKLALLDIEAAWASKCDAGRE